MLKVRVKHFLFACVLSFGIIVLLGLYDASGSMEYGKSGKDDEDNGTLSDDKYINSLLKGYQNNHADTPKDERKRTSDLASKTAKVIKAYTEEKETRVEGESNISHANTNSGQIRASLAQSGVPGASLTGSETSEGKAEDTAQDAVLTGAYPSGQGSKDAVGLPRDGLMEAPKDLPLPVSPSVNETSRDLLEKVSPLVKLPSDEHWPAVLQPSAGAIYDSINFSRYQPEDREYLQARLDVYRERAQVVGEMCRSKPELMVPTNINIFTWDLRHDPNLVWCEISKVASTSWMVNFLRLAHYRENDESLKHLPQEAQDAIRFEVHPKNDSLHLRVFRMYPAPNTTQERARVFANALRFIIVRHPFTRLLSAYLDKMTTLTPRPPTFNFRQLQLDIIQRYRVKETADASPFPTFAEFVQFVIDSTASLKTLRDWRTVVCWTPYWARCGVCAHDFQLIMKIETLDEDERFLVTLADLAELKKVREWRHSGGNKSSTAKKYFKQLSTQQMLQLYERYQLDFQMFGYSIHQYLPLARDAVPER
ncbi:carbohydrate sulfotransferase 11-like [Penaeus chinensis]|uniref:carbohydrate sulfotransferase 11-like n=1 Tax=Penaeus chinensis TaxID=139456 RepID=UPI001FB5ADAD|nr:carbohydrate sulfotransferase 11-like [Penaeus chinensis]